ncbi:hypothetical protein QYE76_018810 [Lolium multiflorum]|uniref:F-box domain-containing protein n=1 Tax=Lolium multiflorum TaxID=4521 RepID=A0AAD8VFQ4_LOLMU|nr:hypothetical protein QYE76_018810 [Lolium multiflorum]
MLPKATAVSIANDILFDILLRMPARALRRFRCVSKQWCALLSDPAFLAAHKVSPPDLLLVDTGYFRDTMNLICGSGISAAMLLE